MKIKPGDITIPCDDPFKHDLLDREKTALTLTNLLQNLESPFTMSIDASWGNGKTTFLNMWKQRLINEGFPVVSFNAWETDFAEYPLIALTSELLNTLRHLDDDGDLGLDAIETTLPRLLHFTLTKAIPWAISLTGGVVSVETGDPSAALAGTALAAGLADTMEEVTREETQDSPPEPLTYIEAKEVINSFKTALTSTAKILAEKRHGKPLVIAIDELDRCRPSYAVELLEIAKHFFTVDNIVFVLAIDKTQLAHAINAIYGNNFDSIGYLRRFIDLDFRLPRPEKTDFVEQALFDANVQLNLERFQQDYVSLNSVVRGILSHFLGASPVSLRQIQQAITRLGLALASIGPGISRSFPAFVLIVLLRAFDSDIYHKFIQAEITDTDVSEYVFGLGEIGELRQTNMGASFEAILMLADKEFRRGKRTSPTHSISSLYETYKSVANGQANSLLKPHAELVLRVFNKYQNEHQDAITGPFVGFEAAAKHIELLDEILPDDS